MAKVTNGNMAANYSLLLQSCWVRDVQREAGGEEGRLKLTRTSFRLFTLHGVNVNNRSGVLPLLYSMALLMWNHLSHFVRNACLCFFTWKNLGQYYFCRWSFKPLSHMILFCKWWICIFFLSNKTTEPFGQGAMCLYSYQDAETRG